MAVKKSTRSSKGTPKRPAKQATRKAAGARRPSSASPKKTKVATKAASPKKAKVAAKAGGPKKTKVTPTPPKSAPPARRTARPAREQEEPKSPHLMAEAEGGEEADPVATAKLAIGPGAEEREERTHIPWTYGVDRVTAAPVDPDRLFVYWEVTDPAISRARAALGAGGPGAWLVLRVYDTSGLLFDGTNANSYFDHPVERSTRQWFLQIGKPTSTAFVELGMKSTEGFFARIARSGRVDFPRRETAKWGDPEWMTVQPWSGEVADVHRAPAPLPGPGPGPGPGMGAGAGGGQRVERGPDALPLWTLRDPIAIHEIVLRHLLESGWESVEWSEVSGEGWHALEGRFEWESPHLLTSWEQGPFDYPVEIEPPRREEWEGRGFAYRVGDITHVVEGPWRVAIRNLGARSGREVVGTWEIRRSWSVHGGRELRAGGGRFLVRTGASEQHAGGASERNWLSGSETRLGGASERWRIGASEIHFKGASERLYAGASQLVFRGASERAFAGASEGRQGGSSERAYGGASESRLGASDQRYEGGPASPHPYPAVPPAGQEK